MPEPILDRQSQFTPNFGELNRDALLFAAGRASARPNRGWISLASTLAATQLLSFVIIWPRQAPPAGHVIPIAVESQRAPMFDGPVYVPLASSSLWSVRHHPSVSEIEDPPSADVRLIDGGTPLRASGPLRRALVN
jgi:hypothetical protein